MQGHTISLRDDDVTWREVDDEIVVLDRRTWAYISVNGSGALLWRDLIRGTTTAALTQALRRSYNLAQEQAEADVARFLSALDEHGLLRRS